MIAALTYEWRRLWSVRSTWIISAMYLILVGLLGGLPIFLDKNGPTQSWQGLYSATSNFLCLILLSVVAAQSFGHEYRYGLIRLTLTEFPQRERVLFAKIDILGIYYLLMTVVGWSVLGLIGALAPEGRITSDVEGVSMAGGSIPELWQSVAWGWGYIVIAFSVTLITRNLALGIVLPMVTAILVENIITGLATLAKGRVDWFVNILPFKNGQAWLMGGTELAHPGLVYFAWVVGLLLLAAIRFHKSDA